VPASIEDSQFFRADFSLQLVEAEAITGAGRTPATARYSQAIDTTEPLTRSRHQAELLEVCSRNWAGLDFSRVRARHKPKRASSAGNVPRTTEDAFRGQRSPSPASKKFKTSALKDLSPTARL
jgi:hypothetical protein